MSKKKIAALLAALMVTLSCLSACSNQNETNKKGSNAVIATAQAEKVEEQKPVTKVFEPGKHVYKKRYTYSYGFSTDKRVNVPDGYEILFIENYIVQGGTSSYTEGFDVWFINTETVEATQSSRHIGYKNGKKNYVYDFYEPGVVIEKEATLELTN